ncbi:hypothetical protein H8E88_19240 [candidate division KSB1 bacterium]|nr:hypothetical protein [candidate division KSB1 bacterium]
MQFINPTGKGIRNDFGGSGHFGAPRGKRKHDGLDFIASYNFEADKGQNILMPISDGIIVRTSLPYKDDLKWLGVHIVHPRIELKMWYLKPIKSLIRTGRIALGTVIGRAQNIGAKKGYENVTPHIHLRIVKIDPSLIFPLENYGEVI